MNVPDLNFTIEVAEPLRFAAAPHIAFKLRVTTAHRARFTPSF